MGIVGQRFTRFFNALKSKLIKHDLSNYYKNIDLKKLEKIIGFTIINPNIYYQAFTHRSFLQYSTINGLKSNERLEFLGDSILNMIVGEYLYNNFPDANEGELTKIRSRLVNRKALAAYARELQLWDFILLSSSASQSLNQGSDTILADSFEALIGAMYLDTDMNQVREFIKKNLLSAIRVRAVTIQDTNYKSLLLEYSQAKGYGVPRYKIIHTEGPDHDRVFTVEVIINNEVCGTGTGKNKKEAEQAAAAFAINNIENLN